MTLTYIFHSGFVLETEQSILVFDYWHDPSGVMDGVLRSEKPMYVFSSHFHEDHWRKSPRPLRSRKQMPLDTRSKPRPAFASRDFLDIYGMANSYATECMI